METDKNKITTVHVQKKLTGFNAYFEMYSSETVKDLKDAFSKRFPDDSLDKYKWSGKRGLLKDESLLSELGESPIVTLSYNDRIETSKSSNYTSKKNLQTLKIPSKALKSPTPSI